MLVKHIYIPLENRKAKGNKTLPKRKKKKNKNKAIPATHAPSPEKTEGPTSKGKYKATCSERKQG